MRPRLLDLFSGAGGAAMGYRRAHFVATNKFGNRHPGTSRLTPADLLANLHSLGWSQVEIVTPKRQAS